MKTMTRFSFLLCMIFLASCQTKYQKLPEKFSEPGKVLSGEEIHSVFSGKTWDARVGRSFKRTYFAKDGLLIAVTRWQGSFDAYKRKLVGKWWIDDNKLCIRFDKRQPNCGTCHLGLFQDKLEKDFCKEIVSDGKGGFKAISPTGKVSFHFRKLLIDNPYKK
ncbi:hypothetical protein KAT92_04570 [Candidatus Babeliales bacterium]|nr:hypothetical protein [Candidatus Babeliales bacterium]